MTTKTILWDFAGVSADRYCCAPAQHIAIDARLKMHVERARERVRVRKHSFIGIDSLTTTTIDTVAIERKKNNTHQIIVHILKWNILSHLTD